jgi:cyclophilin family peptidyl-prolyl cis-trans isomerase
MMGKYILIGTILVLGILFVWGLTKKAAETEKSNVTLTQNQVPSSPTQAEIPVIEQKEATVTASVKISPTTMKTFTYSSAPEMTISSNKSYAATMRTSKGDMVIDLFAKENPITVNNFVFLARDGYYNNTIFHRIIKGFMIQGGDRTGTGRGSPGYRFDDEKITREYNRGIFAMANSGPNTNGSQFFIMHADYPLPKSYVIFGTIKPGDSDSLKTLDALADVKVEQSESGEMSKPATPVNLLSVTITEK